MKKILSLMLIIAAHVSYVHSNNIVWSTTPTLLSSVGVNATEARVAIDASGNAVAAWIESGLVKASSKPVSGSWSAAVTVSSVGATALKLACDPNGNATALWIENGIAKAATKPFNTVWALPITLSSAGAASPTLAVDSVGNAVAGWTRTGDVETSIKLFGAAWQTRVVINGTSSVNPHVAIGGTGTGIRAVAVWVDTSSSVNVVYSSTRLLTGSWSAKQIISSTAHQSAQPAVAVDGSANASAVWFAYDVLGSSNVNVIVNTAERLAAPGTWGAPKGISEPGIRNPSSLIARVSYDNAGNVIALWNTSFDDENFIFQSAVKPVNEDWSIPVDIAEANLYSYSADLSTTTFGDALALYMFYNGNTLNIHSTEADINGFQNNTWAVPITVSGGTNNAYPKIAATVTGNAINTAAVWIHNNGTNNTVLASTGSKTLVQPPSALLVVQSTNNFGAFTEVYNTLSWTASPSPNVVGYLVFRNGLFLEQVGDDVTQYIDNNRTLGGAVKYSVTAVDNEQTQSRTVSVNFP